MQVCPRPWERLVRTILVAVPGPVHVPGYEFGQPVIVRRHYATARQARTLRR
jgi:hypothetical protein